MATSAQLARLLRWDPRERLIPAEEKLMPIELIAADVPLDDLLTEGIAARPEMTHTQARAAAAQGQVALEHWRPWLPSLQVGASGGTFGGGTSTSGLPGSLSTNNCAIPKAAAPATTPTSPAVRTGSVRWISTRATPSCATAIRWRNG